MSDFSPSKQAKPRGASATAANRGGRLPVALKTGRPLTLTFGTGTSAQTDNTLDDASLPLPKEWREKKSRFLSIPSSDAEDGQVEESEEEWESSEHSDQLPKESSDKRGLPEVEKFRMVEQPKAPTCLLERLQIGEGSAKSVGAFNKMLAKTLEKADEKAVLQKSDEKKDDSEGEQSKKRAMEKFFQLVGNLPKMVEVQNAEGGGAQPPATTVKSKFILEKDENEETKKKKKEEEIKGKAAGKGQQDTSGNEKTETNKAAAEKEKAKKDANTNLSEPVRVGPGGVRIAPAGPTEKKPPPPLLSFGFTKATETEKEERAELHPDKFFASRLPSTSPGGTQPPFTFSDPVVLTPAPIRMAERKIRGDLDLAVVKVAVEKAPEEEKVKVLNVMPSTPMKKGTLSVPKREPPAESQKQELVMIPAVLVAAKDSPPSPQLLHGTAVVVTSGYVPGRSAPVLYAYSKQVPDPNQALLKVPLLKRRDKTVVRVGLGDWIQFEAAPIPMADEKSEGNENGVGGNTGDGGGWKILRYLVLPKMPPELGIESIPIHNRVLVRALVYAPPTRPSLRRTDGARGNVESPLVSSISMRTFDLRELIKPHHFGRTLTANLIYENDYAREEPAGYWCIEWIHDD